MKQMVSPVYQTTDRADPPDATRKATDIPRQTSSTFGTAKFTSRMRMIDLVLRTVQNSYGGGQSIDPTKSFCRKSQPLP